MLCPWSLVGLGPKAGVSWDWESWEHVAGSMPLKWTWSASGPPDTGGIIYWIGVNIYTLIYINQMIKKDLLNSIGKFVEHIVITHMQKRTQKRADKCLCVNTTESSCWTPETNTVSEINYISIENNKEIAGVGESAAGRSAVTLRPFSVTTPWRTLQPGI